MYFAISHHIEINYVYKTILIGECTNLALEYSWNKIIKKKRLYD